MINEIETEPSYRHKLFLSHLKLLSNGDKNYLDEWTNGKCVENDDENDDDTINDTLKQKQPITLSLLLKINGNDEYLPGHCICGVKITEHCQIINDIYDIKVWVGNCCIEHIDKHMFQMNKNLNGIAKDITKQLNQSTIDIAFDNDIINFKEYNFLSDNYRKRSTLSIKQMDWLFNLKIKILHHYRPKTQSLKHKCQSCSQMIDLKYNKCFKCHQKN